MHSLKSALVALAVAASVVTISNGPAEASAPKITIHTVADKTVKKDSRTDIRPHVSRGSHVTISSKTMTVTRDGDVIVEDVPSARLKPGTYRVTTTVNFKTYRLNADDTKTYSGAHHKTKTQTLKLTVKAAKKKQADPSHACTTTASGTCIQGGQFCPQAKYGQDGWDGEGRRYVCTGDSDHPHWMVP